MHDRIKGPLKFTKSKDIWWIFRQVLKDSNWPCFISFIHIWRGYLILEGVENIYKIFPLLRNFESLLTTDIIVAKTEVTKIFCFNKKTNRMMFLPVSASISWCSFKLQEQWLIFKYFQNHYKKKKIRGWSRLDMTFFLQFVLARRKVVDKVG